MTITDAKRIIEAAEGLPVDEVDIEELAEALRVLSNHTLANPEDLETVRVQGRGEQLMERAMTHPDTVREQRRTQTESTPPSERGSGSSAGESMGGQAARTSGGPGGGPQLSQDFERRLRDAAAGAGVPDAEVDALIEQAAAVAEQAIAAGQGGAVSLEGLLETQVAEWERIAERNAPSPIGVPQGFIAEPESELDPADRARFGGQDSITQQVEPRYFEGDHLAPASMGPEEITEIQKRLVDAGLLAPGEYWEGFWDDATKEAYKKVLGYSNQRGTDWQETIDDLIESLPDSIKEQQGRGSAAETFTEPTYIKPDYATLAQEVKSMFRSRLGRDPSDEELAEMAGALSGSWRAAHDAAVEVARKEFEAGRVTDEGNVPEGTDPSDRKFFEQPSVGTTEFEGQAVDPAARFAELFENRYEAEIDRFGALDDVRANTENVFSSLRTMSGLIGGR